MMLSSGDTVATDVFYCQKVMAAAAAAATAATITTTITTARQGSD